MAFGPLYLVLNGALIENKVIDTPKQRRLNMYKTITTTDFLSEDRKLTKHKPIFADIETDGLYIRCSLIQLRQAGTAYMITTNTDDEVELMKAYMQDQH